METNQLPTLRVRFGFVIFGLSALFSAILFYSLYRNFQQELRESLKHRLQSFVTVAGLQQDGDTLLLVQAAHDDAFETINQQNLKIKASDPDIVYVYAVRKDERGIYFVVDAGLPSDEGLAEYGEIYDDASETLASNFDTLTSTIVEPEFYTDEYGTFISAYTPIYTTSGEKVGVLGADILATTVINQERTVLFRLVVIYTVLLVVLSTATYFSINYLANPIIKLRDTANRISKGDLSQRITEIPQTRELADLAIDFNAMTTNLSGLITDLEQRVVERTENLTRKTDQLRAASYIARQTAEVQELALLLNTVANLISDQFNFYHTGIYLVNEAGDEVTIQASSSEGGKRMVEKGHSIRIGAQSPVAYAAENKRTRIASDLGPDSVFFNNPNLPLTRSQIALPLLIRGKLLGVLDIQTDTPSTFNMDDVDVLETLADQVAVAIENARLLDESQAAFLQLEALTAIRTKEAWNQKLKKRSRVFTYTPLGLRAEKPSSPEPNTIQIPLTLRGQKIGTIAIGRKGSADWSKLDQDMLYEIATQTGLAIDNLRLLEEATQKAQQEQVVGDMAFRFNQALNIDALLQTAARELGQLSDLAEISVFIGEAKDTPSGQPKRGKG